MKSHINHQPQNKYTQTCITHKSHFEKKNHIKVYKKRVYTQSLK